MKFLQKRDIALAGGILLISLASFGIRQLTYRKPAVMAEVTVNGTLVKQLDLTKDTEITIEGNRGGTNHLIVKDGHIWCSQASCPDKICVQQGKKHLNSDTIVCLPNKMIVTITGSK